MHDTRLVDAETLAMSVICTMYSTYHWHAILSVWANSGSLLARVLLRSPRKLFIVVISKKSFLDQSIPKKGKLKTEALVGQEEARKVCGAFPCEASQVDSQPVILFSKSNQFLLGHFDPINLLMYNKNKQFSGWCYLTDISPKTNTLIRITTVTEVDALPVNVSIPPSVDQVIFFCNLNKVSFGYVT